MRIGQVLAISLIVGCLWYNSNLRTYTDATDQVCYQSHPLTLPAYNIRLFPLQAHANEGSYVNVSCVLLHGPWHTFAALLMITEES